MGARPDARRRAVRPHAAGPVVPGLGQPLPPRRAAALAVSGLSQPLPPPLSAAQRRRLLPAVGLADVCPLLPPLSAAAQRRPLQPAVGPAVGQRPRPRSAVAPADGEFPLA